MEEKPLYILWDCRTNNPHPNDIWKQILDLSHGVKPTTMLILEPEGTSLPPTLSTIMRMLNTKMFVGQNAVEFCYLELALALAESQANVVVISDDLDIFVRPFQVFQPQLAVFITTKKLSWPFSAAPWISKVNFVEPIRHSKK